MFGAVAWRRLCSGRLRRAGLWLTGFQAGFGSSQDDGLHLSAHQSAHRAALRMDQLMNCVEIHAAGTHQHRRTVVAFLSAGCVALDVCAR